MIRAMMPDDRDYYINKSIEFYDSPACDHIVPSENFENSFAEIMAGSNYLKGVIVEYNNERVGYGIYALTYSVEAGGKAVLLEELYIREDCRSHGLGKEFFEYVYNTEQHIRRYRMEVAPDNLRAKKLYSSLGYIQLNYDQLIKDIH